MAFESSLSILMQESFSAMVTAYVAIGIFQFRPHLSPYPPPPPRFLPVPPNKPYGFSLCTLSAMFTLGDCSVENTENTVLKQQLTDNKILKRKRRR